MTPYCVRNAVNPEKMAPIQRRHRTDFPVNARQTTGLRPETLDRPDTFGPESVTFAYTLATPVTPGIAHDSEGAPLANVVDETWLDRITATAERARRTKAYSIERVVWWLLDVRTLDRHGYDAMHIRAEAAAHRWLVRQERSRL